MALSAAATWIGERYLYKRKIVKDTLSAVATATGDQRAIDAANAAIIAANAREMKAALAAADKARREHDVRMEAIRAGGGDVNVGSFRK